MYLRIFYDIQTPNYDIHGAIFIDISFNQSYSKDQILTNGV